MNKSSIDITDQAYLIHLRKDEFEYSRVRAILRQLIVDEQFAAGPEDDDDIISRKSSELGDRFDHLSDK